MLTNTLVGLFCTFISKQPIILSVDYTWSHCLNCFPSASSRVDQINSDSITAQISTALFKRVRLYDRLTVDIGYIINLSVILVPSSRFSYRSQVSYHIFGSFTSLQKRATRLAKR